MNNRSRVLHDERLHVPLRWWVQATMFLATLWLAFVVALPASVAWTATGVLVAAMALLFLGYGAARVRVEDGVLVAGQAQIPVSLLADPVALDQEATRLLAGRDADARAYLLIRPYLKRAVRVAVTDPADPTPYWLVSTRHPDALVDALTSARMGQASAG
ncbi:MAG TPA: DUF3093 domain-containing protein [Nocardioidaceae bacterium]